MKIQVYTKLIGHNIYGPCGSLIGIGCHGFGLELWCLMPLLTIFQLYHGG
jgi:hypothetical protein